jgi:hypothetical protein
VNDFAGVLDVISAGTPGTMLQLSRCEVNVGLRHDMDGWHHTDALKLAQWEHSQGLRSSYYVLHTAPYWKTDKAGALRTMHAIAEMGHEVGLHNDVLAIPGDPFATLTAALEELRAEGFEILGTAAHGSTESRARGAINYEIFANTYPGPLHLSDCELATRFQEDFGLKYEAYSVPRTHYLSDNGGKWNTPPAEIKRAFLEVGGNVVILMHPCHWARTSRSTIAPRSTSRPT